MCKAATANFWQARPPQWWPDQQHATDPAAIFCSAKSRQVLGIGSRGGLVLWPTPYNHVAQKEPFMKRFPVYWYESLQDCEKSNSRKLLQESMSLATLKTRNFIDLINQLILKFRYSEKATNCQNDSPQGVSFWPKDSFVTHILFELCLLWYLAQWQILGNSV